MACFTYEAKNKCRPQLIIMLLSIFHVFCVPQHLYRASRQDVGLADITSHCTDWRVPFFPTSNTVLRHLMLAPPNVHMQKPRHSFSNSLADPRGDAAGACAPPPPNRIHFFRFRMFLPKSVHVGGRRPPPPPPPHGKSWIRHCNCTKNYNTIYLV